MPQITIKDAFGANQVVAATADTGQTVAADSLPVVLASDHSTIKTQSDGNIKTKFREAFEAYTPNTGGRSRNSS